MSWYYSNTRLATFPVDCRYPETEARRRALKITCAPGAAIETNEFRPAKVKVVVSVYQDRRVLYVSYNGILRPFGSEPGNSVSEGVGRAGVNFTLLSFERFACLYAGGS